MKRHFSLLLMAGCAVMFAFGIVRLVELRFEIGDVYPAYSSLRSDPLGTMALYESLGKVPGISTRRDFSPSNRLPQEPHTVYLHLAASRYESDWVPNDLYHELEGFLSRGDRLVITFLPQTSSDVYRDDDDETNSVTSTRSKPHSRGDQRMTPGKRGRRNPADADEESWVDLAERWGFGTGFEKLPLAGNTYEPVSVANKTELSLPPSLAWHSGVVFTNLDRAWHVIYARGDDAVILERHFGKGSVVMATDSYFVSNEAMERDRHSDLLAWLVGTNATVVFDEGHLGIVETPGVTALMRKYRLHGVAAGLILLAGLFIWKNSLSLVPPHTDKDQRLTVAGKDASAGFVNLLRRSIAPRDLLGICFAEWKKSTPLIRKHSGARFQQAETEFQSANSRPLKDRNPVHTYNHICSILGARTHNPNYEHGTTQGNPRAGAAGDRQDHHRPA